jgi:poly(3-hydroxybutyrate) depolymerase
MLSPFADMRLNICWFSNGGGFIGTLACSSVGGRFATFAAGSGAFYTDINGPNNGCSPARTPLPMLEIHGGDDKTVFYPGGQGEGGPEPNIQDWLAHPKLISCRQTSIVTNN